jgi:hypothetical protein
MSFNATVSLPDNSRRVDLDEMPLVAACACYISVIFRILYINIKSDLINKTANTARKITYVIS